MTVALSVPYDDELLYSVIARYMEQTCVQEPSKVISILFGRHVHPTKELVCGLGELAHQTQETWRLSALEVARRLTLLPYFATYATDERRTAAYVSITGNGTPPPAIILRINSSTIKSPPSYRFCRRCVSADLANGRRPYWRRAHQLPGVFTCATHGCLLQAAEVSDAWAGNGDDVVRLANKATVLEVARRSINLLAIATPFESLPCTAEYWFSQAQQAGFVRPSGYLETEAICGGMRDLFGSDYLDTIGARIPHGIADPWPARMMRRRGVLFHPLQHILLEYFLQQASTSLGSRPTATGRMLEKQHVICPNMYAMHGAGHVVDRVVAHERSDGRCLGVGHCSCGLHFTFTGFSAVTFEPPDLKVVKYGKDWYDAARRLRCSGLSFKAIAHEMNIPVQTAYRMVNEPVRPPKPKPERTTILKWREEWDDLLSAISPGGHYLAAKRNGQLYYRLHKYDRGWLTKSTKRCTRARQLASMGSRPNWADRDKKWSAELIGAAARLRRAGPRLVRASRTAIAAEARLRVLHPTVNRNLPLCLQTLADIEESVEQFRIRRLRAAARDLSATGTDVTRWRLLTRSRISVSHVTPNVAAVVKNLISVSEDD
ncbi:TniQ family protein [Paraburkholderia sp. LEh10]|uniref:TnsD family Tn7-like transposition protein n=1 Tax=Paraburkholderia sp. LEh10 TaxID=2821353 RepID=UPI001AEA68DA|nr:TnsD family Tn7-like transposition protein [Paraburkholderia sp. LEh10]MBP0594980.1 TniQ family protein [Paraburkholderia sp. LEh10]